MAQEDGSYMWLATWLEMQETWTFDIAAAESIFGSVDCGSI